MASSNPDVELTMKQTSNDDIDAEIQKLYGKDI